MSYETDEMLAEDSPVAQARGNNIGEIIGRQANDAIKGQKNVVFDAEKNYVYIVKGKIAIRADYDKIVILLDKFKTGYECSNCKGAGTYEVCPKCNNQGKDRFNQLCTFCGGEPEKIIGKTCATCRGIGTSIVIPESAKAIPTSGIIVSIGPDCKSRKIGDRVLFGAHTGYMLPFKGNVKLRIMREHEPLCSIMMLDNDESVLGDFIHYEDNPVG
jgi:co-chaperonin GroES (HSP10)